MQYVGGPGAVNALPTVVEDETFRRRRRYIGVDRDDGEERWKGGGVVGRRDITSLLVINNSPSIAAINVGKERRSTSGIP